MKKFIQASLILGLFLNLSSAPRGNFYQVTTSHPHDLKELTPYIETAYQNGRLWVVTLNDDIPQHALEHVRPLKGGEKSYLHKYLPTPAAKNLKNSFMKSILAEVDEAAIKKDIEDLSTYKTRAAGTQENRDAVAKLSERFTQMGYEIKETCYQSNVCGVVAEKRGRTNPERIILVEGHIDSVGKKFAGADDNGSGTAVLMEMARVLKDYDNNKTLRFFITNGEELGLLGANHYAEEMEEAGEIQYLDLVINMDMVGYNKSNNIVELETEPEHENLAKFFANLAGKYTSLKTKITLGAWGSDHVPFLKKGAPTLLTIENWDTKTPCYHMECDKPDTINYGYAREIGKLNVAAVVAKDQN